MKPKMFAKLHEAMLKFVNQNCETDEWQQEDFLSPDDLELMMAKAAELVFDTAVQSSQYTERERS